MTGPAAARAERGGPEAAQPRTGLAGLVIVVGVFFLVAFGAGGAENSLRVVGPLATFGLPVVATIAFWWNDWPGTNLRAGWSGLVDTVVAVAAAVLLTLLGQAVVGEVDPVALLDAAPGPGHSATFPATLPLAAAVFTAILQLTLVTEGWPVRRLPRLPSGIAALILCWLLGAVVYLLVVHPRGPVPGAVFGAWLTAVGVWQVLCHVVLRGWPLSTIRPDGYRRLVGNVAVVAAGWATYLPLRAAGWEPDRIGAVGGCVIAAGLVVGLLFEPWPTDRLAPATGRWAVLAIVVALSALLYGVLSAYARQVAWRPGASADDWITFAALDALGLGVILHVAIWRRWPVAAVTRAADRA
ncbi:hypothetical protein AB0J86_30325 [Micromonospora sp. NPDC049559]|uniref:hypothetical protein n=1 Tax=Micromonospora sp. NPDC049559 TaxID=3155923 RepID=UPI0034422768